MKKEIKYYDPRESKAIDINNILDDVSKFLDRSDCLRRNYVAALYTSSGQCVKYGWNSAPEGTIGCESKGDCLRKKMNIPHGERYELCRSIHAEQRCIIGTDITLTKNGTLFLVGKEYETGEYIKNIDCCNICKKMIIEAGIKFVVFRINSWGEYKIVDTEEWKIII